MSQSRKIKNIVIAGAGPIGTYAATKLAQLSIEYKLDLKITVVDKYIKKRIRPGIIAHNAAKTIEASLLIELNLKSPTPGTVFIAELEEAFYKKVTGMPITFLPQHFRGFSNNTVQLADEKTLPCDLFLDCTGGARAGIHAANTIKPTSFPIAPIGDNPLKNHFIAYVTMDEKNDNLAKKDAIKNSIEYALNLEELRINHGWDNFTMPYLRPESWEDPKTKQIVRVYYFEIPATLAIATQEKQIAFLKALLKLKTGENIEFSLEEKGNNLKFGPFEADPTRVTTDYLDTDGLPLVVPCGDAQMSPDYRLGHGIESGIMRFNAFYNALIPIPNTGITLNGTTYQTSLQQAIGRSRHIIDIENNHNQRRSEIQAAQAGAENFYQNALKKATTSQQKTIIQARLLTIYPPLLVNYFQLISKLTSEKKIADLIKELKREKLGENENFKLFVQYKDNLDQLTQKILSLNNAINLMQFNILAKLYKDMAKFYFSLKYLQEAKRYYIISLSFYQQDSNNHLNEILSIYSNLVLIEKMQKKPNKALFLIEQALDFVAHHPNKKKVNYGLIIKIKCNQLEILVDIITAEQKDAKSEKSNIPLTAVKKLMEEFEKLIKKKESNEEVKSILADVNSKLMKFKSILEKSAPQTTATTAPK